MNNDKTKERYQILRERGYWSSIHPRSHSLHVVLLIPQATKKWLYGRHVDGRRLGERVGCLKEAMREAKSWGRGERKKSHYSLCSFYILLIGSFFDSSDYHNPNLKYNICVVKCIFFDEHYSYVVFNRSFEPPIQIHFFFATEGSSVHVQLIDPLVRR